MSQMRRYYDSQDVVIAAGDTTSTFVGGEGWASFGLLLPSALTGTSVTFTVCTTTDGTFVPLKDSAGVDVTVSVAASTAVALPAALAEFPYWKIVSNAGEGGARTLTVLRKT